MQTLFLHILSDADFDKFYSFNSSIESSKLRHMFNYWDSLSLILENILLIFIFDLNIFILRYLSESWACINQAIIDFKSYMQDMYKKEKHLLNSDKSETDNIVICLVQAFKIATTSLENVSTLKVLQHSKTKSKKLIESEVYDNIFMYNFVDHDTTAITLS